MRYKGGRDQTGKHGKTVVPSDTFLRACAFRRRQVRPMAPSPHGVRGCMSLTVLLTHTRLRTYNNESLETLCMLYMIITSGSRARPVHFLDVGIDVIEVISDGAIVREVVPCRVHHRLSLSYRGSCRFQPHHEVHHVASPPLH